METSVEDILSLSPLAPCLPGKQNRSLGTPSRLEVSPLVPSRVPPLLVVVVASGDPVSCNSTSLSFSASSAGTDVLFTGNNGKSSDECELGKISFVLAEISVPLREEIPFVCGEEMSSGLVKTLSLTLSCVLPSGEASRPSTVGRFWLESSGRTTASDLIENSNFSETGKASGELGTSEVSSSLSLSTAEKRTMTLSNVLLLFFVKNVATDLPSRLWSNTYNN